MAVSVCLWRIRKCSRQGTCRCVGRVVASEFQAGVYLSGEMDFREWQDWKQRNNGKGPRIPQRLYTLRDAPRRRLIQLRPNYNPPIRTNYVLHMPVHGCHSPDLAISRPIQGHHRQICKQNVEKGREPCVCARMAACYEVDDHRRHE